MGLFLLAHIPPSPSLTHSSHGFNHPTIDSQLLGPCQTPRSRRVGDLGSLGVGFWDVPFGIGMHIKVVAQLRATLQKSNVLSTLCPLFIGDDSSIVLQMRSLSLQDPPTQTLGSSGSLSEAIWWAPRLPATVLSSTACELGFYKSAPGDQLCARCPPHSHSATPAAQTCRCDLSYYRAALDPPSAACTREYCLAALLVGPPRFRSCVSVK